MRLLILTLISLFCLQSIAASQDYHLLHSAAGGLGFVVQSDMELHQDSNEHGLQHGDNQSHHHCCHSHFIASIPFSEIPSGYHANRQQTFTRHAVIRQLQLSSLYRPPIS